MPSASSLFAISSSGRIAIAGVTVILTTHDMDDIEALCTRIMVIGGGRILSDGPLEQLRAKSPASAG